MSHPYPKLLVHTLVACCLGAFLPGLSTPASALPATAAAYELDPIVAADAGKIVVMTDGPDGALKFTDEQGWYTLILPPGAETEVIPAEVAGTTSRDFYFSFAGVSAGMNVKTLPGTNMHYKAPAALDAYIDAMLTPGSEEDNYISNGTEVVKRERFILGDGKGAKKPVGGGKWLVKMTNSKGEVKDVVYAVVPSNRGNLAIMCLGEINICDTMVTYRFRLGAGAFQEP